MRKERFLVAILVSSIVVCFVSILVMRFAFYKVAGFSTTVFVNPKFWPEFDSKVPYTINGPLWVGFDEKEARWKYLKIKFSNTAGELQRGLVDPGIPSSWSNDKGDVGFFSCSLQQLPSGTHINNRYDPSTLAFKYNVDDIMVKVGDFWTDKYESSIVQVSENNIVTFVDDPLYGGLDSNSKSRTGNGFDFPRNAFAVSQRRTGTSGITYFVAEQAAVNNGKHIIRNEQWQAAASGTLRTDATGMKPGGEDWSKVQIEDISRFGLVGCVGSLWEWTSSWGQYGEHYTAKPTNWYDWPGPGSYNEWDDKYDTYGDDIIINIAGRAYTRQDSARYAPGLPSSIVRGGSWGDHSRAGVFAIIADGAPSYFGFEVGFRCVK